MIDEDKSDDHQDMPEDADKEEIPLDRDENIGEDLDDEKGKEEDMEDVKSESADSGSD